MLKCTTTMEPIIVDTTKVGIGITTMVIAMGIKMVRITIISHQRKTSVRWNVSSARRHGTMLMNV